MSKVLASLLGNGFIQDFDTEPRSTAALEPDSQTGTVDKNQLL